MIKIKDIKLPINHNEKALDNKIASVLKLNKLYKGSVPKFSYQIKKRSIDARKKPDIYYIYSVSVDFGADEQFIKKHINTKIAPNISFEYDVKYKIPNTGDIALNKRPVVVGSGPAGLFCALLLAMKGFKPIIIERGEAIDERSETVQQIFDTGIINTESNVQFGEGGAGTFSDGKLNTLTKDTNGRNTFVLETFAKFGAQKEITYDAKPHIGTDKLKEVIKNMREHIKSLGGEFHFSTKMTDIILDNNHLSGIEVFDIKQSNVYQIHTDTLILCIGHSARDTFEMLYKKQIDMTQKSFAVGFRIQHPQSYVDNWQYGVDNASSIGLMSADYKVTNEATNGRRVYSFCMCPGGYVVNASSEKNMLAVNGMSESRRDSGYANSAIIVGISPDDFIQDVVEANHPLSGMYYQRRIEAEAFNRGNGLICGQYFSDYENNTPTTDFNKNINCTKGTVNAGNLRGIFTDEMDEAIIESIHKFGRTRKGFDDENAILYGVETRTSSPIRITRNDDCISNYNGIYPCGEGAGYAGGITSAAADGLRVAESIISRFSPGY